jgi:hypothetical protein
VAAAEQEHSGFERCGRLVLEHGLRLSAAPADWADWAQQLDPDRAPDLAAGPSLDNQQTHTAAESAYWRRPLFIRLAVSVGAGSTRQNVDRVVDRASQAYETQTTRSESGGLVVSGYFGMPSRAGM